MIVSTNRVVITSQLSVLIESIKPGRHGSHINKGLSWNKKEMNIFSSARNLMMDLPSFIRFLPTSKGW